MPIDLSPTITRQGHAVLAVASDHPARPPWSCTVGRAERGRPDLVVYDLDRHTATAVLDELVRLDDGTRLQAGAVVDLWPGEASVPVRLCAVRAEHLGSYLPAAVGAAVLGAPRALQVGLPDADGVLPAHGLVGCECCPDLTRAGSPWAGPFDPRAVGLRTEPGPEVDVCIPVITQDGTQAGRTEVVPCRPLGDGTVEVLDPPVLADWVTAGAVLEVARDPDPSGLPLAAVERRRSPLAHLTWWIHHRHAVADAGVEEQLCAALDRVAEIRGVAMTWADDWLAVAVPPGAAGRARSCMRHLVRDGFATETRPHSAPTGPCTGARRVDSSAP